jgi:H/ACA ribonucleoprotein complex subunit 3
MLRTCSDCGRYTLQENCPRCGEQTRDSAPPKFSPEDKHGEYRRRLKRLDESDDPSEEEARA